jgi:carbonic anhydrase/acetyltransferase-like protein (isoleucine patch superfamily)
MSRPLIFVGCRQQMRQTALLAELNNIEIAGILDHHYYGNTDSVGGVPVIGDERWLLDANNRQAQDWLQSCDFFPANWHNGSQQLGRGLDLELLRLQRIGILEQSGANVINLIHPNSSMYGLTSKYADFKMGRGILIDDMTWISIDSVEIGDYCAISLGTKISHHVTLGKNVMFAAENYIHSCTVGSNTFFGMYSRISARHKISRLTIGDNCTVWAGAEVKKSIPDNKIYTHTNRILTKRRPLPDIE